MRPAPSRRSAVRSVLVSLVVVAAAAVVAMPAGAAPSAAGTTTSCQGFRNRVGVTNRTITIANVSDLSGPVPQLYQDAQLAVKAFAASFDATSSICGRKLRVLALDSRTDASADRAASVQACRQSFAAVGSLATFDSGGAARAQRCGLPDLRAQAFSTARYDCSTCFATQVVQPGTVANAIPDFFVSRYPAAVTKGAFLYLNAGAAASRAATLVGGERRRGVNWVYTAGIDVAAFNYGPYVEAMKSKSVRFVQFLGAYQQAVRLAQAMASAGFSPDVYLADSQVYDRGYVRSGGSAVQGTVVPIDAVPLEQAATNTELHRYKHWLHVVAPGVAPTYDGLFAWSAARLFAERAISLGGRLSRANLVAAIARVHRWTTTAPMRPRTSVAGRTRTATASCGWSVASGPRSDRPVISVTARPPCPEAARRETARPSRATGVSKRGRAFG